MNPNFGKVKFWSKMAIGAIRAKWKLEQLEQNFFINYFLKNMNK
jgi:hypothetical protein